jgi:hypothetical protein
MSNAFHPLTLQRVRIQRAAFAVVLALALVCAQSLGLWHRLVHLGPSQSMGLGLAQATVADAAPAQGLLAKLFSNHQGDPDCQFFDHASYGDAVGAAGAVAVALALAPRILVAIQGPFIARWHALFQARGPPHLR